MASEVSEANEAQRQRLGVHGQCPGRDSEPDKVIFNTYCAIIEPRLWNIVPGTKKKKKKKNCARRNFFFSLFLCRAEIVSGGRPCPAPPTVATTLLVDVQSKSPY